MEASTAGAFGSTSTPKDPRKSRAVESIPGSCAPSSRIFQDVCLLRNATSRTSRDSSLVRRPTSQFLSLALPASSFTHLNGFVGGQFDENIRKRHGFRKKNAIFQRCMRIAGDGFQQCRGTRESGLFGTVRQRTAREFAQFGGIRGVTQPLVGCGQRLEIRRNVLV